ncbi:MAG: hypothetical protein U5K54_20680 [Cytophagales bacterium]|nr:hypothetical protein [Cytophagales bacterium]
MPEISSINRSGHSKVISRILQGAGTTASFSGDVAVNGTNTHASTVIQMGVNGTTMLQRKHRCGK